ncbi:thioredoxin domain-containing protein [Aphanothece hegewaldii CCALA 016]|uniref:Thioredoxin domain-containing protein n=1 Tax=Aphanothece hegewaldii CCALA 016 TaxID=2107694 RepID=A0A2T1LT69_9CHRO|nr:thioredoxin domain-containing protein [Aphanothece hegewaldii]PSF33621.1 thioredoxin domain-containing protein [Aphanothece hegewaldii CCALA 016]
MSNRLAQSQSLYLRKHANNPIDWWYWCPEALNTAKRDNKPVFLSIGYSSCHWCTVMEGEAFSDSAIATYLNGHFLPIKVDREERPDIDSIYMQALQTMISQGGWPLNIFLTPDDLVPFYGGTYFPVEPRFGRPGFLQVLQSVRRFYDEEKDKLNQFKQDILGILQQSTILPLNEANLRADELLYRGIEINTGVINTSANNFNSPSFPMIPYANLTLQGSRLQFQSTYDSTQIAEQRGEDLALGGIYDHVGGGFHRYTVDATWTVPHFEKMLYDNGQIVEYLANLWSRGKQEPAYKRAIALTIQWLQREMTSPEGYFYAAQDADSFINPNALEPDEGSFYIWSEEELEKILNDSEFALLKESFTITEKGNFDGNNVLQRRQEGELSEAVESALDKLFTVRYGVSGKKTAHFPPARNNEEAKTVQWPGRIPAVTDTKMIVAWNSLMISGLARAYGVWSDVLYWTYATNAAQFILDHQWVAGRFMRLNYEGEASILAQSEDYAFFIKALLDLQTANPSQTQWLEHAIRIQQEFDDLFWSLELGGYYNTSSDNSQDLIVRERSYIDNATPSANGVAVANLVRLARLTDNLEYLERAEQALKAFGAILAQSPQACPSLFVALDWYRYGQCVRTTEETLKHLIPQYFPTTVYRVDPTLSENYTGIICQGLSCLEPATSYDQLLGQMRQISSPT